MISELEAAVGEPKWVSRSDAIPIAKAARDIARRHGLSDYDVPEELFKLRLDVWLSVDVAHAVLMSVRKVK